MENRHRLAWVTLYPGSKTGQKIDNERSIEVTDGHI